jgi:hypothetical protein
MRLAVIGCLLVLLAAAARPARAVTVDFRHLTDAGGADGEIVGNEFVAQGLLLSVIDGIALNVGCGNIETCLGADSVAVDDFQGAIRGTFVVPGTTAPASVLNLQIDFCCTELMPAPTSTTLFDARGNVVGQFTDGDVAYLGSTPVAAFETHLGYDAMSTLSYSPAGEAVPEPGSLVLLAGGLTALVVRAAKRGGRFVSSATPSPASTPSCTCAESALIASTPGPRRPTP